MEKRLSPYEAWEDFWKNALPEKITNELYVADRAFRGVAKKPDGKPIRLGEKRIVRLIKKYAPGRYEYVLPRAGYFVCVAAKAANVAVKPGNVSG
jgi:hypothetical protein